MTESDSSQKEILVTYETLYELLRIEKQREDLQKLNDGFLMDVLIYLREKQHILDEAEKKQDLFSIDEREKTQLQLVNIRKIIRELYERREKKIIDMAVNRSRTKSNLIDTTALLIHEHYLFDSLVAVLDSFRSNTMHNILSLREPVLAAAQPAPEAKTQEKEQLPEEGRQEGEAATKRIKFLQPVEQFVGKELELYGPFKPEQKEHLPAEIADILIQKGSAVEAEQE